MNFKKLPKEKRNQLILVVVLALGVMSALGFGLIRFQYANQQGLTVKQTAAVQKLAQMRDAVKHGDRFEGELVEARKALQEMEGDLASGDLYAWVINTLRKFKAPYKVEIPQFSPIGPTSDVSLLPNFPYKQAAITVAGTGNFHDFGRFLADFENQFPHIRVLNLRLDGSPGGGSEDQEKLSFTMEIVCLVKPNAS